MYIFYCVGGKFGEVAGACWQHRTLVQSVRCGVFDSVSRAHRTLAPDTGRLLFERPVVRDVSECARGVSDR